jgi:DNA-binding NarL/FixJ family response regulator
MMTSNTPHKILVIGEYKSVCRFLTNISGHLSITATAANKAEPAGNGFYEIVIVDLQTLNEAGVKLIENTIRNCSYVKIIALKSSETHDEQQSFGVDIFRCLGKPVDSELLSYTVQHALEIQTRERITNRIAEKLELRTNELAAQRLQVEYLNQKLLDKNAVLSQLTEGLQREREQVEKRIALNLRSIVIPAIDKLKKIRGLEPYSSELDLIVSQIEDITSDFIIDARIAAILTTAEIRIASLIKNGLSTEEIAMQLHILPGTVRSHRKRIRKKLRIDKDTYSLNHFLLSQINGANDTC